MINLIVASSQNGIIGKNNKLPWYIPEDMKRFKFHTRDNVVIMGRKTYESIGKALPKRENIVLTKDPNFKCKDAIVVNTLDEALMKADRDREIYIIGGSQIYDLALKKGIVDRIFLTRVWQDINGDSHFSFDESQFELKERDDRKSDYLYSFMIYERK